MLKTKIRTIPHYPKPGIMFRDITTALKDPVAFQMMIQSLVDRYKDQGVDKIVGIESRGFILGAPLAYALGVGFVPIRKQGKLPAETIGCDYELEYGMDRVEIHVDALEKGQRIVLVDDLIATGGTAEAGIQLLRKLGAHILECSFVIDLPELGGAKRIEGLGIRVYSLTQFEGH
jgi:adenine phosphoribosyltransferase